MDNDTLLRALLRDYIIYTRLVNGLCSIGLSTEDFAFGLGDTIFKVMDLGEDERSNLRFDEFISTAEKIIPFDHTEWKNQIYPLIGEVHDLIMQWKKDDAALTKN